MTSVYSGAIDGDNNGFYPATGGNPFGEQLPGTGMNLTGSSDGRYKFTSKELDPTTSLYYFGARYYSAWSGRWMSVDPLSNKYPGWGPYDYVEDNPIGSVDPNGARKRNNVTGSAGETSPSTIAGAHNLGQTVELKQSYAIINNKVVKVAGFQTYKYDKGSSKIVSTFKFGSRNYVSTKTIFPNGATDITGPDITAKGGDFHSLDYAVGKDASNRSLVEVSAPIPGTNSRIGLSLHFSEKAAIAAGAAVLSSAADYVLENGPSLILDAALAP